VLVESTAGLLLEAAPTVVVVVVAVKQHKHRTKDDHPQGLNNNKENAASKGEACVGWWCGDDKSTWQRERNNDQRFGGVVYTLHAFLGQPWNDKNAS